MEMETNDGEPQQAVIQFPGFDQPETNFSKLPHGIIDLLPQLNGADLKILIYIFRHTWGFQNFTEPVRLTNDEIVNGRRRKGGERWDKGTGLSLSTVQRRTEALAKMGILQKDQDDTDAARIMTCYSPKCRGVKSTPQTSKKYTPGVSKVHPDPIKEITKEIPGKKVIPPVVVELPTNQEVNTLPVSSSLFKGKGETPKTELPVKYPDAPKLPVVETTTVAPDDDSPLPAETERLTKAIAAFTEKYAGHSGDLTAWTGGAQLTAVNRENGKLVYHVTVRDKAAWFKAGDQMVYKLFYDAMLNAGVGLVNSRRPDEIRYAPATGQGAEMEAA